MFTTASYSQQFVPKDQLMAKSYYIEDIDIEPITTIDLLNTKDWVVLLKRVQNLTKKQKRVVYLYYWKGLYQHKIAKKYNTTQSNICNTLKRARDKMKYCL